MAGQVAIDRDVTADLYDFLRNPLEEGASAANAILSPLLRAALPNPSFVARANAQRRLIAIISDCSGV